MINTWKKITMVPEWTIGVLSARLRYISGQYRMEWDSTKYLQATYPGDWWDAMVTSMILGFDD